MMRQLLHTITIPLKQFLSWFLDYDPPMCTNVSCCDNEHRLSIDKMYMNIINTLSNSSRNVLPDIRTSKKYHTIQGCNEYVKEDHSKARDAFLLWQCNSKPRFGLLNDLMKCTRARFKQCLRFCKSNDDRVRADVLTNKLLKRDDISFWKDVSKMNRINSNVLASTINGVSGECNITKMWHDHFSDLLMVIQSIC